MRIVAVTLLAAVLNAQHDCTIARQALIDMQYPYPPTEGENCCTWNTRIIKCNPDQSKVIAFMCNIPFAPSVDTCMLSGTFSTQLYNLKHLQLLYLQVNTVQFKDSSRGPDL
jgi:hypothetical protein